MLQFSVSDKKKDPREKWIFMPGEESLVNMKQRAMNYQYQVQMMDSIKKV